MINIDENTNQEYLTGYLDGLSDTLGKLGELPESPAVYKIKELLRETIKNAEEQLGL